VPQCIAGDADGQRLIACDHVELAMEDLGQRVSIKSRYGSHA
jgi:hypothetical protein